MSQARLNHVMQLNLNREKLDQINLRDIGNKFIRGNEHRLRQFGIFSDMLIKSRYP